MNLKLISKRRLEIFSWPRDEFQHVVDFLEPQSIKVLGNVSREYKEFIINKIHKLFQEKYSRRIEGKAECTDLYLKWKENKRELFEGFKLVEALHRRHEIKFRRVLQKSEAVSVSEAGFKSIFNESKKERESIDLELRLELLVKMDSDELLKEAYLSSRFCQVVLFNDIEILKKYIEKVRSNGREEDLKTSVRNKNDIHSLVNTKKIGTEVLECAMGIFTPQELNEEDSRHKTPLIIAVEKNNINAVRILLSKLTREQVLETSIELGFEGYETVLECAMRLGHVEIRDMIQTKLTEPG